MNDVLCCAYEKYIIYYIYYILLYIYIYDCTNLALFILYHALKNNTQIQQILHLAISPFLYQP